MYTYLYIYIFVCLFKTQIHVCTYACTYNIYAYPNIVYANVYVFCITCHINFPVLIWQGFNLDRPQGQNTSPSPEILNSADQSCAKMLQMCADCCFFGFCCGHCSTFLTF